MMSPRRKMVAETPCHKQVSQVLLRTPGKQTLNSGMGESDDVVEESPEKQVKGTITCDFPTIKYLLNEPREKTGLRGFRPGLTQTRLYSYRRWLEA